MGTLVRSCRRDALDSKSGKTKKVDKACCRQQQAFLLVLTCSPFAFANGGRRVSSFLHVRARIIRASMHDRRIDLITAGVQHAGINVKWRYLVRRFQKFRCRIRNSGTPFEIFLLIRYLETDVIDTPQFLYVYSVDVLPAYYSQSKSLVQNAAPVDHDLRIAFEEFSCCPDGEDRHHQAVHR